MPLIYGKKLLKEAIKQDFTIPAFGFVNLEEAKAIVQGAEELNAPIIMQTTQGGIDYAGQAQLAAIAISLAKNSKIPIVLHLDHGRNLKYHKKALQLGYSSLMIDGSQLSFDQNIKITNQVSELVKGKELTVEAELGIIGGKEDDLEATNVAYTDPKLAVEFVKKTNIDMLAIACGTSHGFYKKTPKINYQLIKEIGQKTQKPIVLHGGSDLSDQQIKEALKSGIRKANFDSELKKIFINTILEYMKKNPDAYDIRKIFTPAIVEMKKFVKEKIVLCNAQDKNWL